MAQNTEQTAVRPLRQGSGQVAVRCIALKDGGLCKAVCVDLGLYVQRPSLREAMSELEALIRSYVQDAREAGIPPERLLRPISKEERAPLREALLGRDQGLAERPSGAWPARGGEFRHPRDPPLLRVALLTHSSPTSDRLRQPDA